MDLTAKNILVIGGAGFIGSHVVDFLLKEPVAKVLIYDNFTGGNLINLSEALKDPRCKVFEPTGDILHQDTLDAAMRGIDAVFHLAGAWLLHCHQYPDSAYEINVRGTFNVVQSCIKNSIKKLIFSSSASVYGDALTTPMTEEHPYNNFTLYGATKIAGEHLIKSMLTKEKIDWIGLRYMNVYGERQDYKGVYTAVIHKILDKLYANQPPEIFGTGEQEYDFIYVTDVARANIAALKSEISGEFLNVSTGVGTTLNQLTDKMLKIRASTLRPIHKPQGLTFVQKRIGSTENARKKIDFTYDVGLDEGLRLLVQWRDRIRSKGKPE